MKIQSATYIKSAPSIKDAPDFGGLPEFVLVGRSNVGKSSFINAMTSRKNMARTSNTPGKTRLINFYQVVAGEDSRQLVFVDLPGYGYAKVSKTEQQRWQKNLEVFLTQREPIELVIQLIDARHEPQASDIQMFEWLAHHELPQLVILTKIDKLSTNQVTQQLRKTAEMLEVGPEFVVPFSAESGKGREVVWRILRECMDAG